MFLLSDHTRDADAPAVQEHINAIYGRLPKDQRMLLTIRGANHFGFSDDGAFLKSPLVMKLLRMTGILRMDGYRQIAITTHCVDAFFDVYLKRVPESLTEYSHSFPDVITHGSSTP